MKTVAAKLYEGMFLVDSALAASDWQGINETIKSILDRVDAQIVSIDKWDERKLAYDIRGKSRGTYILVYFRVDGGKIAEVERLAQLNENIVRVLILSIEDLGEQYITKLADAKAGQSRMPEEEKESIEDQMSDENATDDEHQAKDETEMDVADEGEVDKEQ